MKITKRQLRRIIKEEKRRILEARKSKVFDALDDAVKAVSDPDKKPEITTSKAKNINSIIVNKDIIYFI